jgi:hypothetical protein
VGMPLSFVDASPRRLGGEHQGEGKEGWPMVVYDLTGKEEMEGAEAALGGRSLVEAMGFFSYLKISERRTEAGRRQIWVPREGEKRRYESHLERLGQAARETIEVCVINEISGRPHRLGKAKIRRYDEGVTEKGKGLIAMANAGDECE